MPQEITRTQIEKYTVYTGPTAESFSPTMAGITYPDPAYEILVYRRPLCVFEYVLSGRGHIERNGSILTVNAGDAYILTAGTYHHYYSDKVDPWTKIWFNVSGSLVQHLLSDYGLDGVTLIPRFHNETPLTRILDAFTADLYTLLTSWLYCSINIFRSWRIFWQTKFPSILLHWRSAIISICT